MTSDIFAKEQPTKYKTIGDWQQAIKQRRFSALAVMLQILCDLTGFTNQKSYISIAFGYLALVCSVSLVPPPFAANHLNSSYRTHDTALSIDTAVSLLSGQLDSPLTAKGAPSSSSVSLAESPLIATRKDVSLTLLCGAILGLLTLRLFAPSVLP